MGEIRDRWRTWERQQLLLELALVPSDLPSTLATDAEVAAAIGAIHPSWSIYVGDSAYGAVGDGVADDRAAINAAINAAAFLGGGTVELMDGADHLVASSPGIVLKERVHLRGRGGTRIIQGWWPGTFEGLITATGTYTNTNVTGAVMTADVVSNTKILTMTSTANLTAGQFYLLGADRAYMDAPTSSSNDQLRYRGEIVRIDTIDSGTQVTLRQATNDNYHTATGASLRPITYLDNVKISGLQVVNPQPNQHSSDLVKFSYVRNYLIEDVILKDGDGCGVHLDMCLDGKVDVTVVDLTDNAGAQRYGYGVLANRATQGLRANIIARGSRHAFSTNGVDNRRGVPRNIVISGTAEGTTQDAFDTHVQGANISFIGCSVNGAPLNTSAFQIRSPATHVIACSAEGVGNAVVFNGSAHGSSAIGNNFRHSLTYGGPLIYVVAGKHIIVKDNVLDGAYVEAIRVTGSCDGLTVVENLIQNPGARMAGDPGMVIQSGCTGSEIRILRNTFVDFAGSTDEARSSGQMTYPIDCQTIATGYIIADNIAIGASQSAFVGTNTTGHTLRNNRQLDRFNGSVNVWLAGAIPASDTEIATGEATMWWNTTPNSFARSLRVRGKDSSGATISLNFVDAENGGRESMEVATLSSGNKTVTLSNGNVYDYTLAANTTFAFSGATTGYGVSFTMVLRQDATGSRTATWPASVDWGTAGVPTLTTTASKADILTFMTVDGGTKWYGFVGGKGFS